VKSCREGPSHCNSSHRARKVRSAPEIENHEFLRKTAITKLRTRQGFVFAQLPLCKLLHGNQDYGVHPTSLISALQRGGGQSPQIAIIIATALRNCASEWYNRRLTKIMGPSWSYNTFDILSFYYCRNGGYVRPLIPVRPSGAFGCEK